ncbi:MAG: PQQ-dependent sugar dehydrogenase [Arenimonas sp.]
MKPVLLAVSLAAAIALPLNTAEAAKAVKSADYTLLVQELNTGLKSPWGMAFLPDKRILVTQKPGTMLILSADGRRVEQTLANLPAVAAQGQGGLLDVALDPDFARNRTIYWSYAEPGSGAENGLSGTAVARGVLGKDGLSGIRVIYRQVPKVKGNGHFGSRLVFGRDGNLFVTLGDRQKFTPAQDMAQSLGKVVRITREGRPAPGNPAWKTAGARPEIYSLGHRNPQGAALHPVTGALWLNEHGPQGGDEINRVQAGRNYGWPDASYGCNYGQPIGDTCRLGGGTHAPKFVEPLSTWTPISVAPAGRLFYTGKAFPAWNNDVLMGSLAGQSLWRLRFDGDRETVRERLLTDVGERIRDIEQGPDGFLYLLTDSGKLLQIKSLGK